MENHKIADGFVSTLRNLANDLEQVQVEFALGKAEAKDKWDEYSKNFKKFIHESKLDYKNGTGVIGDIRSKVENLEVQFELGKADLKDFIDEQKKKLNHTINEVETVIKNNI